MTIKTITFLSILSVVSCSGNTNSKTDNHKKPKNNSKSVLKLSKIVKPPLKGKVGSSKGSGPDIKLFDKDKVVIKKNGIYLTSWGVKFKNHLNFGKKLKKHHKPHIYKKSQYIDHHQEVYSFNFTFSRESNLFLEIRKIDGPIPTKIIKFEKSFDGKIKGKEGTKGALKFGIGNKRIRGPGHCSRGRCMHRMVDQLNGYTILPLSSESYIKCHISVAMLSDLKDKKFNDYFNICLSLTRIKNPI